MLVKDILSHDYSLYNLYNQADACVFIDKDSNAILNHNGNLYPHLSDIPQDFFILPVSSHSFVTQVSDIAKKHRAAIRLAKNALFANQLSKLAPDSRVLVIVVSTAARCYVVTEKYFNDGTHFTSTKCMMTSSKNISTNFYQSAEADTFVDAFDSEEDALAYLRSPVYISNVQSRSRNRMKKCGGVTVIRN